MNHFLDTVFFVFNFMHNRFQFQRCFFRLFSAVKNTFDINQIDPYRLKQQMGYALDLIRSLQWLK